MALKASAFLKRSGTKEKRTVSRASHYADHRYGVHSTLEFTDLKLMKTNIDCTNLKDIDINKLIRKICYLCRNDKVSFFHELQRHNYEKNR